jgi:hypothetical protein
MSKYRKKPVEVGPVSRVYECCNVTWGPNGMILPEAP